MPNELSDAHVEPSGGQNFKVEGVLKFNDAVGSFASGKQSSVFAQAESPFKQITPTDDMTPGGIPDNVEIFDSREGEADTAKDAANISVKDMTEAIDSADFDQIYKTVKDLRSNPEKLEELAKGLNKELSEYGMSASVNYPEKGSKDNPELVLKHKIEGYDSLSKTENTIRFSSKPGVAADQSSATTYIDGSGSGGGGPLKPDGKQPTVSNVLRRMSHDRTH